MKPRSDTEKTIHDRLNAYQQLQKDHLRLLETDPMPDLAKMAQDRNAAFLSFKKLIDDFVDTAGDSGDRAVEVLSGYEEKMTAILALDKQIGKTIQKYKEVLTENLKRMRAGRTAMKGYARSNTRLHQQPSVLSMNR